jgi:DNA replication protein DnaC
MMLHPLLPKLRQLKMSGMVRTLEVRASQAVQHQLTPVEFLALLVDDELERRNQERFARRLAQSGCDGQKTLARFDFAAAPGVNRTFLQDLATCAFITRHENLLVCGPSGVGKTHLLTALAIEALKQDLQVLYKGTHRLLADLHAARANGTHPRLWARVLNVDLLVLDDFGLESLAPHAAQDLYELISERYECRALALASNRSFEEWPGVFGNDLLASAAVDRLTHHAHTLVLRGESYRQTSRRKEMTSLISGAPVVTASSE